MPLEPQDSYNKLLEQNTHPTDWQNPVPSGRYDLVAIGGGTAGLISALAAAGLGARAALLERSLLGGDCLNFGCVPSKALLRAARAAHDMRSAGAFGCRLDSFQASVDFPAVMERMRRLRAEISQHDSATRLKSLGVDVYLGEAQFTGRGALQVAGQAVRFRRAVVATGAHPREPEIAGLAEIGFLTNETVFSLTQLPRRLVVIGAGPVGCELAQAFSRFGSDVHLINRRETILPKEDREAAEVVKRQFESEQIHLQLGWTIEAAERMGDAKSLIIERNGQRQKLIADEILIGVGRQPNTEGLDLEAANVAYSDKGIHINDRLQTSNWRIYAAGDVCGQEQFTHAADAMARICVQNALFGGRKRLSRLVIPRCTFTDPEIAHVGLTVTEAAARTIEIDSYRVGLDDVDRAVLDGEEQGFAVVHTFRGTGRIAGATIVARHAGEMIGEITLLMTRRISLGALATVIHCYPTQVEALKRIADNYRRTKLTPIVSRALRTWLRWSR
jgi:pyruvate/2-oxoglutarate dehydrogenase complex dihydrolipoamide dehydrogenase (E3) component